jgi:energy-coupling factor transporter ATP-binding protein EcfA2
MGDKQIAQRFRMRAQRLSGILPLVIKSISLRFGPTPTAAPVTLAPGHMTVFVGPNNSGKTLVLREIQSAIFDTRWPPQNLPFIPPDKRAIVSSIKVEAYGRTQLEEYVGTMSQGQRWDILRGDNYHVPGDRAQLLLSLKQPHSEEQATGSLSSLLRRERVCFLDGLGRLTLSGQRQAGPLNERPRSHLQSLFVDDERRSKLKQATKDALGFYVLINPTNLGQFQFCLADKLPARPELERSLGEEALAFYAGTRGMEEASDGVKAYTGILSAVLSTDFDLILIDEPEAFLHPPLARRLGFFLTDIARERKATVFASTHSADFLAGCVQSGSSVDVIRLTYDQGVAGARLLSSSRLTTLMRDPLFRSTGVLSSVFYRGAIVCESDTDRAFYSEINDRLLRFSNGGVEDSVFLNAQNWQTCANITAPLREMGIPAATVVDLDVLLSSDFSRLLDAASVPAITTSGLTQTRAQIKGAFERAAPAGSDAARTVKERGISCLSGSELEAAQNLLAQLRKYGIFIVSVGEVEMWLRHLGISGHASRWLIPIFERIGNDPTRPGYVRPDLGDVWEFIRGVAEWIEDPHRLGMPS